MLEVTLVGVNPIQDDTFVIGGHSRQLSGSDPGLGPPKLGGIPATISCTFLVIKPLMLVGDALIDCAVDRVCTLNA
jgi:hypothetical protein